MMLIAVVSVMLYHYIRVTVFQSVVSELNQQATAYKNNPQNFNPNNLKTFTIEIPNKTLATVKAGELKGEKPYLVMQKIKDKSITTLTTRLDDSSYLVLEKETTLYRYYNRKCHSDTFGDILRTIFIKNAFNTYKNFKSQAYKFR